MATPVSSAAPKPPFAACHREEARKLSERQAPELDVSAISCDAMND